MMASWTGALLRVQLLNAVFFIFTSYSSVKTLSGQLFTGLLDSSSFQYKYYRCITRL